ncbi:hypothetical protein PF006_g32754 [Phytophthora fragariae]|uniref:Uncharacterized protein n=3 Tax=Phytophthora fragariae TaxID=53985 RepID=A0A6A3P9U9_9STRA|nr:hypothetical protein PF006_g32754 [Phytophthora fragariae]
MQLKHAGGAAIWEASKDRPVLQANKAHLQKMNWVKMIRADYIDFIATSVLDGYNLLNETYEKDVNHSNVKEWYTLQHNAL